ncbi:predicted protein [Sclerotinia sclerotiorum 1980 UF-70]|uniref:Uncharacterized protein n=1 Tax=Sclerotinia sclerotiorum (strain ATCC 18683 / 1980 / Ss-1) TaxID=665079 RepID=A7EU32_SCLS1|nr:predicted protein [Sclerotinia sclerotiorum 1980 UF-70]EDN92974.1 predicted protein [Sclerotinia sclerotiorum 1980 UF-70]
MSGRYLRKSRYNVSMAREVMVSLMAWSFIASSFLSSPTKLLSQFSSRVLTFYSHSFRDLKNDVVSQISSRLGVSEMIGGTLARKHDAPSPSQVQIVHFR